MIEGMLGRSLGSVFPDKTAVAEDAPDVLTVERLRAPGVEDVSFTVRAGEVVGLAGLVGAGRSEIAHAVFGAVRSTASAVRVDGRELTRHRIGDALRRGVFLVPESRKEQGLVAQLSVRENVTMGNLAALSTLNWIRRGQERRTAHRMLLRVGVQGDDSRSVTALSGGNQQKVMFGRALQQPRRVLIADEPTRGVDVGSRRAIYELIVEQARAGVAVLVISSDVEEVLGLAHRVLVVRAGRIVAELSGAELTEQNILSAAFAERAVNESDTGGEGSR
jgi:simple sugar transport system ATP-binding protein/ribose transport system ATP-binding protein